MKKLIMFIVVLGMVGAVAAGCALVDAAQDPTPAPTPAVTPDDGGREEPAEETATVVLYFAGPEATEVQAETREVVVTTTVADAIIQGLIEGPQDEDLYQTLPEGTELLELYIEDGIAYVDFSAELKSGHSGGTTGELMTVQSIVASLCELDAVDAVQLLLEGEKEEAIFGHGCTRAPIEPDVNYINR